MLGSRLLSRHERHATWVRPAFPSDPADEQRLVRVDDAYLTPFSRGRLRSFETPNRWIAGAVHDAEGHLVVESQLIGGYGGRNLLAADPRRVRRRARPEHLEGTWLYGGHLTHHFGHFIAECLPTLWPEGLERDGLVFHRYLRPPVLEEWHAELLGYAGHGGLPVEVVSSRPVAVDTAWVPTRPVTVNGWAHPQAVEVWRRIVAAAGGPAPDVDRVWFTRAAFNDRLRAQGRGHKVRSTPERDRELDRVFAAAGFAVVAPEELPVREQVRLAAGARVLAGQAGSALHLAVFAETGTRCLEVGDSRTPWTPMRHQQVIHAVRGHEVAFLADGTTAPEEARALEDLGVCG